MPNLAYTARKFNARENDPNPLIKHISILPKKPNRDKALAIMKAVAAQMKRIMERMKLVVNSFEEYPHNKVLAHIQQMNHGPAFKTLNTEIRNAVKAEQAQGYYGDGFYSSGIHLASSAVVESDPLNAGDAPEYICGGAADRQAPGKKARTGGRKRLLADEGEGSSMSGAQTGKRRKAGSSNTKAFEGREDAIRIDGTEETSKDEVKRLKALVNERKAAFRQSHGLTIKAAAEKALNSLTPAERRLIETSTHGKSAKTATAREARAAHFERLLAAKAADNKPKEEESTPSSAKEENAGDYSESDVEPAAEEDLDNYAKGFLAEMDEDERKVARGDDVDFFENAPTATVNPKTSSPSIQAPRPGEDGFHYRSSSAGQRAKAAAERLGQPSTYRNPSPKPDVSREVAKSVTPSSKRATKDTPGFGQAMIGDEKRRTRADLLGLKSSNGEVLGMTEASAGSRSTPPDAKYWPCSISTCGTFNAAARSKCAKCGTSRVANQESKDQSDVIVIDD